VDPVITIAGFSPNVNCVGAAQPTGLVTINVDGAVPVPAEYTVEWFEDAAMTITLGSNFGSVSGAGNETAENLPAGTVYVQVTDVNSPNTNCVATAMFVIIDNPPNLTISAADLVVTPNDNCSPGNGAAQVLDVQEDGISMGLGGYEFEWFDASLANYSGPAAAATIGNLDPATYYVQARNSVSNCTTSHIEFEIEDIATEPFITASVIAPNVNCLPPAVPTGAVTIEVNGAVPLPAEYTIQWFEDAAMTVVLGTNFGLVAGAGNETAQNLPAGNVYVRVTDINTPNENCISTAAFTIMDDQPILTISAADLNVTPNDNCSPGNGAAQVIDVQEDGISMGIGGYEFEWFDETLALFSGPAPAATLGNLDPATYYVQARNVVSNCITSYVEFEIEDISTEPEITVTTLVSNTNCTLPALPSGQVTIEVNGAVPNPAGHLIEWFEDAALTISLGTNFGVVAGVGNESATQLPAGDIYVRVTDISSPDENCVAFATFTIVDDLPVISVSASDLVITSNTNCVNPNGAVIVNSVLEDGVPMPVVNYEFEWYDDTFTLISGPAPLNSLNNLAPGTYYVNVRNITSQCDLGTPIQFVIDDITLHPVVTLFDFANPTRCEGTNSTGNLRVQADGSLSTVDYTFEWYSGGTPVVGPPIEPNNYEIINLAGGDYTVIVTNNTTGCATTETYTLATDVTEIQVAVSSSPVTSCITENGSVFAAITNTTSTYDYYWYIGNDTLPAADFTTQQVMDLPEDDYTVVAVDQADAFCVSRPATVRVEDQRILPEISIVLSSPSTHCDPGLANAQLTATVNGQIVGYTFEWREGIDSTSANVIYTGPVADNLWIGDYTVVATDVITGCAQAEIYTVVDESGPVAAPDAVVISNLTSCVTLNGAVEATVGGITREHDFYWFNSGTPSAIPDFEGSLYTGLDVGTYTVRAVEKTSGCISDPASVNVIEDIVYPDFEIVTGNSVCTENSGFALVNFLPGYSYLRVEWDVFGQIIPAPAVYDLDAGDYDVTVYGAGDCSTTKTASVGTDILIYNGVSPNGDGMNDTWVIDCIDNFINNNVKLFNRSGQLVYESDNYNNADVSFNGEGNRGVYLMGNNVPDGTYYYIIDKGDGSEPRSGYIELYR
jgi:gliding motility-associated-like protein